MKLKKILILVLVSILLNVCTIFAYQLIYEKMDKMLDKSGMKQEIIDSQTKPKTESKVSITSPSNNSILYTSTLTIQGTATGDNLEYVEVRRDTDTGQGTWTKATGTTLWQHAFLGCSNQTYTVKARAYSASGLSKETSINVTTSLATPGLSYTLINNEYAVGIGSITSGIIDIPNSIWAIQ